MKAGVKISISNRDMRLALSALAAIVKDRGFPDAGTASDVGRTIRRLRELEDEMEDAKKLLIQSHVKTDEDGKPIETGATGVVLATPREFLEQMRVLEKEIHEVEVFPVLIKALGDGTDKKCGKCKQLTGMPGPEEYATLLDLGILVESKTSE